MRVSIQKGMVNQLADDKIRDIDNKYRKEMQEFTTKMNRKLMEVKERELEACRFYEQKLKEIDDQRTSEQKVYEENVNALQGQLELLVSPAEH